MRRELQQFQVHVTHSAADGEWAEEFARLLAGIMPLAADQIRCIFLESFQLPPGSELDARLEQASAAPLVLIALISQASLASPFEMFALGSLRALVQAAPQGCFIPVILDGFEPASLPEFAGSWNVVGAANGELLEEIVGQLAGCLGISPMHLSEHRGRLTRLAERREETLRLADPKFVSRARRPALPLLGAALVGLLAGLMTTYLVVRRAQQDREPPRERFSFEQDTNGWSVQTSPGAQGCTQLSRTGAHAHSGEQSLEVDLELDGSGEGRRFGEVLLDLRESEPGESTVLSQQIVTAWVYASSGTLGDPSKPNGLQLFAKDRNWKSHYGTWTNVVEGQWVRLTLPVGAADETTRPEPGFQANAVVSLGVKVSLGEDSTAKSSGAIYIDSVDW